MKTLNIKTRAAGSLILAILFLISVNTFADGDRKSTCPDAKVNNIDLKELTSLKMGTSSVMSPTQNNMTWMVEEYEEELIVLDIDASYEMRPLWNCEAVEFELEVEEFKSTEEIIPTWMIVEAEPELEVTDLTLN